MDTNRLQEVFRDVFDEPGLTLRREMTAEDVEAWDSLSHINLLAAIEKEYKIRFDLAEVKSLRNVGDLMDMVAKKAG